jgi:hypothetical protein
MIGVDPDISFDKFESILRERGSPALSAARPVYDYCVQRRVSPAALLAMFQHESSFGLKGTAAITHSWGNTRPPAFGGVQQVRLTTPDEARSGQFSVFQDWADGGISTVARWLDHKPYQGRALVPQIIAIWAPPSENNTNRYVDSMLESIRGWVGEEIQMNAGHVPQPPINVRTIGIPPKVDGIGCQRLAANRTPRFTCVHSMVGTLMGTDGHFNNPGTDALTDFGIGLSDHGGGLAQIIQWNDPFGNLLPFANGVVKNPDGDGKRVIDMFGLGAVNRDGVSIELDDNAVPQDNQGRPTTPVSAAQWSSLCWLLAFIHAEWLGQTADTFDWNVHHREFATKDCPFPRVYNHTVEYQNAVKAIMRHCQDGAPYPASGVFVAGKKLTVPVVPGPAGFLRVDGTTRINGVDFSGTLKTLERVKVEGVNGGGQRFLRRWRNGALDPWVLVAENVPVPVNAPIFPGALQADGRTVLNDVDFGGKLACLEGVEVEGVNKAGKRFQRRWIGGVLHPWQLAP